MVRFLPHPTRLASALAVAANTSLSLGGCAAASQSADDPLAPSLAQASDPRAYRL